jgi:hypothetical protein
VEQRRGREAVPGVLLLQAGRAGGRRAARRVDRAPADGRRAHPARRGPGGDRAGGPHRPLLATALARARTLETLAHLKGAADPDAWFAVGLLSVSDALAGAPLPKVVERLPLADDVRDALVHRAGAKGEALAATIACERAELPDADRRLVLTAYADAIAWADAHAAGA